MQGGTPGAGGDGLRPGRKSAGFFPFVQKMGLIREKETASQRGGKLLTGIGANQAEEAFLPNRTLRTRGMAFGPEGVARLSALVEEEPKRFVHNIYIYIYITPAHTYVNMCIRVFVSMCVCAHVVRMCAYMSIRRCNRPCARIYIHMSKYIQYKYVHIHAHAHAPQPWPVCIRLCVCVEG